MNDLHTRDTIQLTRIHALNWYGFSDSFDLVGQTVITGVYGCGKTALIDLVQTVLLGVPEHENRYNLSVGDIGGSARQIKRDLRGYVLQDLNIMESGSRVFARQGGRSYIALEWSWPDGERRETWGNRVLHLGGRAVVTASMEVWFTLGLDAADHPNCGTNDNDHVDDDADEHRARAEAFEVVDELVWRIAHGVARGSEAVFGGEGDIAQDVVEPGAVWIQAHGSEGRLDGALEELGGRAKGGREPAL
jgi:hypothetical protein